MTRIGRTASGLAVLALLPALLTGCGARMFSRGARGGASAPPAAAKAPRADDPRAQAALHTDQAFWPYRLAADHFAADSLAAAETELRQALAREPRYAPALALMSKLLYREGRHEEAIRLLEPVRATPEAFAADARPALLAGLALHEDAIGRLPEARAALAGAGDADGVRSAAVYVTLRGESPEAATPIAAEAVHENGRSAVNQNNYGVTRLRAGDPEGARKAFLSAIDRDPSLPGPYYNLAILEKFYRLDDEAASRWFEGYWARSHADPDSLLGVFRVGSRRELAQKEAAR